jgi:hypothetical protein
VFGLFVKERIGLERQNGSLFKAMRGLPKQFNRFLIGVGIFGAGDFAHSLLTLRAIQMLTPSLGASRAGEVGIALYIMHNIFYAGMSYPIDALADRIGKRGSL